MYGAQPCDELGVCFAHFDDLPWVHAIALSMHVDRLTQSARRSEGGRHMALER